MVRSFKATPYKKRAYARKKPSYPRSGRTRVAGYYGRFSTGGLGASASELKFFDTALSFSIDATGEVPATGQLNLIPQGVTESTRIGRKAVIKSLQVRAQVTFDPAATNVAGNNCTVYLIQDTQTNGAAAAATDVFDSTNFNTALLNMANSGRFRIMKKWKYVFNSQAGVDGAYGITIKTLDFYKKCNIPLEFSSTTGAITELRSNNVFLMASGSVDDGASFVGNCRIRYAD